MALSQSGLVVMKPIDSSGIIELRKQLILPNKLASKYKASIVLQSHVSRNCCSSRSLRVHKLRSSKYDSLGNMDTATAVFDSNPDRETDGGDDHDDGGVVIGGGGGDEDDHDEIEFGPLMKFEEVMKVAESNGVNLPEDMLEAAKATGLRELSLTRYLALQKSGGFLGFLTRNFAMLRNRLLADPSSLFKVGTEMVIDSCCATFAEVKKRGKDFWNEFELYAADLLVGIVVDVALVGMLAPHAQIGKQTVASGGLFSGLKNSVADLPSRPIHGGLKNIKNAFAKSLTAGLLNHVLMFLKRNARFDLSFKCCFIAEVCIKTTPSDCPTMVNTENNYTGPMTATVLKLEEKLLELEEELGKMRRQIERMS